MRKTCGLKGHTKHLGSPAGPPKWFVRPLGCTKTNIVCFCILFNFFSWSDVILHLTLEVIMSVITDVFLENLEYVYRYYYIYHS